MISKHWQIHKHSGAEPWMGIEAVRAGFTFDVGGGVESRVSRGRPVVEEGLYLIGTA